MKRKQEPLDEDELSRDRWLISYADYITLLFAFFVILYATSQKDFKKGKEFEDSVKHYLMKMGSSVGGHDTINTQIKRKSPIKSPITKNAVNSTKSNELESKIETYIEKNMSETEIERIVKDLGQTDVGVRISLSAYQLFANNSDKLKKQSLPELDKVARFLKPLRDRIFIESHTSNRSLKGSRFTNHWELAADRATNVVRYLVKIHGINPKLIAAISYGSKRPVVPNDSFSHQNRNERLDILIATEDFPL